MLSNQLMCQEQPELFTSYMFSPQADWLIALKTSAKTIRTNDGLVQTYGSTTVSQLAINTIT